MLMRRMRQNTKWIMLLTAAAFVALMVFEWGMDITGISSGGGELGRVDGTSVTFDMYNSTYRNLYEQVQRSQSEPISSQQNREIENQAWEEVVGQILIQQELARRGIVVTDDEIRQAALFSPPPEFRTASAFQTEGQFDLVKYQQYISTAQDDFLLMQLEAYYRDIIPRGKLLRQVTSGIYVSDAELWRSYRDQNERVEVRYIALDPEQRVADSEVPVTRSEVEAYYRANRDDFAIPARAQVKVAYMMKAPLPADSLASRERAEQLRNSILAGDEDFAEVARLESADQGSGAVGGNLGVVPAGQAVPVLDSAIFSGAVGTLQEPVLSPFGYHILQVDERWGADSARVRHILIPVERTDRSEMLLLARADSLERGAAARGLESAAAELGLQVQTVEISADFPFVPGPGQVGEAADWALEEAEPGEASPVFENQQAFYAVELVQAYPSGFQSLDDVAPFIEQTLRFGKKMDRVAEEGERWAADIRNNRRGMDEIAAEHGLAVRVTEPFTRADFVPGLGVQNAAIGAAFGLHEEGALSRVVRTETNAFILQLVSRTLADREAFEAQKEDQRYRTISMIEQQRLEEWLDGLRNNARVVDRRVEAFRRAEEAQDRPQIPMAF